MPKIINHRQHQSLSNTLVDQLSSENHDIIEKRNKFILLNQLKYDDKAITKQNQKQSKNQSGINIMKNVKKLSNSRSKSLIPKSQCKQISQNHLKKQKLIFAQFQFQITVITKHTNQEQFKRKILLDLNKTLEIQIYSEQLNINKIDQFANKIEQIQIKVNKQRKSLEKISNSYNFNINENQKLLEKIKQIRKDRILNETYYNNLEKQIKKHETYYYTLLFNRIEDNFFGFANSNDYSHGISCKNSTITKIESKKTILLTFHPQICSQKLINENEISKRFKSVGRKSSKKDDFLIKAIKSNEAQKSDQLWSYRQSQFAYKSKTNMKQNNVEVSRGQNNRLIKIRKCNKKEISMNDLRNLEISYKQKIQEIIIKLQKLYLEVQNNIYVYKKRSEQSNKNYHGFNNYEEQQFIKQSSKRFQQINTNALKIRDINRGLQQKNLSLDKEIEKISENSKKLKNQLKFNKQESVLIENKEQQQSYQNKQSLDNIIFKDILKVLNIQQIEYNAQLINIIASLTHSHTNNNEQKNSSIAQQQILSHQNKKNSKINSYKQCVISRSNNNSPKNRKINKDDQQKKFKVKLEQPWQKVDFLLRNFEYHPQSTRKSNSDRYDIGNKHLQIILNNIKISKYNQRANGRQQFLKEYQIEIKRKKRMLLRRQAKRVCNDDKI